MTTTFRNLQDEVLQILQGYGLDQPRTTFLNGAVTNSGLSFVVDDASSAQQGLAEIEGELVFIQSVDRGANTLTIAPDGRGYFGTTAAAHADNTRIVIAPTWPRNRVKDAINDIIVSTSPTLFGVGQTQFTFNPSVATYELPSEADRVLSVSADTHGPSLNQQQVRRYHFSSVAPTDDWDTTNTITFHEAITPGRTVTVTYAKQPTALSADTDLLTASGLRNSAKALVVYGACSQLVTYLDVARLPVDTATAGEYAEPNQVGMASRIAGQLYLRHQTELEAERRRLRQATPVPITTRK